jgi:hypothetical protein
VEGYLAASLLSAGRRARWLVLKFCLLSALVTLILLLLVCDFPPLAAHRVIPLLQPACAVRRRCLLPSRIVSRRLHHRIHRQIPTRCIPRRVVTETDVVAPVVCIGVVDVAGLACAAAPARNVFAYVSGFLTIRS